MMKLKKEFISLSPDARLYHLQRPIIAITGGIATGKSTVSKILKSKGLHILDADQLVKKIYDTQEAKDFVRLIFPEAWDGQINFKKLRELFFKDPSIKDRVESFIYARLPEVFREASREVPDQDFYLYDIPLLFEKNLNIKVDLSIVVYAPGEIQFKRLVARDQCTEDIAKEIINQQMNIEDKKMKADLVIDHSGTSEQLEGEVNKLLLEILN